MMSRRVAFLGGIALAGCGPLDREGTILLVDKGYRAEIALSNKDGLGSPDGLLWKNGRLYVADEGAAAVRFFQSSRQSGVLADERAGIAAPEDLAAAADGSLFFTDDSVGGLWQVDASGRVVQLAGKERGLTSTEGLVLAPSGDLLVGENSSHSVLRVGRDGRVSTFLGRVRGINKPESMAFDGRGNLYIADNKHDILYLLTPDGRLHRPLNRREGFSPESIHYSGGALFVTDSKHGKLHRYTPEDGLETVAAFGGKFAKPSGITSDEAGNLYVGFQTDLKRKIGYVVRFRRKATFTSKLGAAPKRDGLFDAKAGG